jgi:hypothetical protein
VSAILLKFINLVCLTYTDGFRLLLDRTFLTNIPTLEEPIHKTLHDLVRALNPNIFVECMPDWARAKHTAKQRSDMLTDAKYIREMDVKWWYTPECKLYQAVDLMKQCLALDLTKRVTAADALFHPFITVRVIFQPFRR